MDLGSMDDTDILTIANRSANASFSQQLSNFVLQKGILFNNNNNNNNKYKSWRKSILCRITWVSYYWFVFYFI
jgi:hypothetical protein